MLELFNFELKENTEPEDSTRIKLVNFYFSEQEKERFNELCKIGMVKRYGLEKAKKGNALDFLLDVLEHQFGDKAVNPAQLQIPTNEKDSPEETNDGRAS